MKQKAFTVLAVLWAVGAYVGACVFACPAEAADRTPPRYVKAGEGLYWPVAKREKTRASEANSATPVYSTGAEDADRDYVNDQNAYRGQRNCATDPTCVYVPAQPSGKWEKKRSDFRAKKLRGPLPVRTPSPVRKSGAGVMSKAKPTVAAALVSPQVSSKPSPVPMASPPSQPLAVAGLTDQTVSADLNRACTSKDPNACLVLGRMYATGNGVAKNEATAVQRYTQSCDLGNGTACYALGVIYELGAGAKHDSAKAHKFYALACSRGSSVACESAKTPAPKQKKPWKLGLFGF